MNETMVHEVDQTKRKGGQEGSHNNKKTLDIGAQNHPVKLAVCVRSLVHFSLLSQKENRSTSFKITGAAGFALFGGSKVVCLRNPRSGSRVTSDRAFSLSLSPAARG